MSEVNCVLLVKGHLGVGLLVVQVLYEVGGLSVINKSVGHCEGHCVASSTTLGNVSMSEQLFILSKSAKIIDRS